MLLSAEEVSLNNSLSYYQQLYRRKVFVQNLFYATFQYNEKQVTAIGLISTSKEVRFQDISVIDMLITFFKMSFDKLLLKN